MNKAQNKIIKDILDIKLSKDKTETFENYEKIFLEKNLQTNLISKNDQKFLFEKHIFDSLAINKFFKNQEKEARLLDIGTGGGFPSVPIAITYDNINVYAADSIRKKINIIEDIKTALNIKNLFPICERVENLPSKEDFTPFDYITTRAVAPINDILKYAVPNLKKNGYFIAYKSKKAMDELKDAQKTIKTLGVKIVDIIDYTLPLEEVYERNLIIFQK